MNDECYVKIKEIRQCIDKKLFVEGDKIRSYAEALLDWAISKREIKPAEIVEKYKIDIVVQKVYNSVGRISIKDNEKDTGYVTYIKQDEVIELLRELKNEEQSCD